MTVDCVMRIINEYKLENASVLLADGTSLGEAPRGSVGYTDLSGVIGNSIKAIRDMRRSAIASNEQAGNSSLPIALPFDADQLFDKVQEVINSRPAKAEPKNEDDEASSDSSSESKTNGYDSGDNAMSDKDLAATKPKKWPASQESSSSNDSILNYDIHASAKHATKPKKWPANQESQESSSSNDSILDYDIFSSKKPKAARSRDIRERKEVIDLSLDDDGDDEQHATKVQITLPLENQAGSDTESVFSFGL